MAASIDAWLRDPLRVRDPQRGLAWASRALLLAMALLYLASPWTEWFWSWDGFAHGGQDMELGLMAVVAVLCLGCAVMGLARLAVWSMIRRPGSRGARMHQAMLLRAAPGRVRPAPPVLPAAPDRATPLRL